MPRRRQQRRPAAIEGRGVQPVDEQGRLVCLLCGNAYDHLGGHVAKKHAMAVQEYKGRFQLPAGRGLVGESTRRKLVEQARRQLAANPQVAQAFFDIDSGERARRLAKAAAVARQVRGRAGWTANRRRGPDPLTRARHDETARAYGYQDLADMLERTWHLPRREVAARLGLNRLHELHLRHPDLARKPAGSPPVRQKPAVPPVGGRESARRRYDQLARELGYRSVVPLLAAHQHLTNVQLAGLLGVRMGTALLVRKRYAPQLLAEHTRQMDRQRGDQIIDRWRAHYDQQAQRLSYECIDELIDSTRDLPSAQLAQMLALSAQVVRSLRRRYGHSDPPPLGPNGNRPDYPGIAARLGYPDLPALLAANTGLSHSKLAKLLAVGYGTAWRLRNPPHSV